MSTRKLASFLCASPRIVPLIAGLAGCGGTPDASLEDSEIPPRETADTASVTQAFGEATCTNTVVDFNCGTSGFVGSLTTYGHSTCTDTFIVKGVVPSGTSGAVSVEYAPPPSGGAAVNPESHTNGGPLPDGNVFPCNTAWVRTKILKYTASVNAVHGSPENWSVIRETTVGGNAVAGGCTRPVIQVFGLSSGEYRILAQAGFITFLEPVWVNFNR